MKPIKRPLIAVLAVLVFAAVLTAGWLTADAGGPPQETAARWWTGMPRASAVPT